MSRQVLMNHGRTAPGDGNSKATVFNFTNGYKKQHFHEQPGWGWLDFTDISGVNGYCDGEAAAEIRKRLESDRARLHFLDNGNFHYITYFLLQRIDVPLNLIVLDHHTDMIPSAFGELLSCGCWIRYALDYCENIRHVVLIGVADELAETVEPKDRDRVTIVPESVAAINGKWMDEIVKGLSGPVYLSVDKDAFSDEDVAVNWDQGTMRMAQLEQLADRLAASCCLLGADVCGECDFIEEEQRRDQSPWKLNDESNRKIAGILTKALF